MFVVSDFFFFGILFFSFSFLSSIFNLLSYFCSCSALLFLRWCFRRFDVFFLLLSPGSTFVHAFAIIFLALSAFRCVFFALIVFFFQRDLHVAIFADCVERILCAIVSAHFVRFFLFSFCSFWLLAFFRQFIDAAFFGCIIFAFFTCLLSRLLFFFLIYCFLDFAIACKYRRHGLCRHSHAFFTCPPIRKCHANPQHCGHSCTSALVCACAYW